MPSAEAFFSDQVPNNTYTGPSVAALQGYDAGPGSKRLALPEGVGDRPPLFMPAGPLSLCLVSPVSGRPVPATLPIGGP